jgi:hypothetical protein
MLPNTKYTTTEWMLSAAVGNYSASITTYAYFFEDADAFVFSNFSLSVRALKNILITQQAQFDYVDKKFIAVKTEIEKMVFRNGYLNASYEKNFSSNITNIEVGLRYDFSFAQARLSVRKSNDKQAVGGSLIHDGKSGFTTFNNYSSVGTGAVLLIPFLDMNGNNLQDKGEPRAQGLKVQINGGRIKQSVKDTTISITNLEAYTDYNIELDPAGFDRLAWKLSKKNYRVTVDPNFVKNISVPVSVYGEASGRVILQDDSTEKGQGGVVVKFYNDQGIKIAQTVAEADGYFSYLGFLPGVYLAKIDADQLTGMSLTADSIPHKFTIIRSIEGSLVNNLTFNVKLIDRPVKPERDSLSKEVVIIPPKTNLITDPAEKNYTIQVARFKHHMAMVCKNMLLKQYKEVIIYPAKHGYYNIRIKGIQSRSIAKHIIKRLKSIGFPDAYVLE